MKKKRILKRNLPKQPMPKELNSLYRNLANELYEITECGVTYSIPFELVTNLKMFFINYHTEEQNDDGEYEKAKVQEWYQSLNSVDKQTCHTN